MTPASGTSARLGMLFAMHLDLGLRRLGLGFLARRLRAPGPGGPLAGLHVVPVVPR